MLRELEVLGNKRRNRSRGLGGTWSGRGVEWRGFGALKILRLVASFLSSAPQVDLSTTRMYVQTPTCRCVTIAFLWLNEMVY